jgi:Sideroflexins
MLWTLRTLGWKAVKDNADGSTTFVPNRKIEEAKELVRDYRRGKIPEMNEDLWKAKKSTFYRVKKTNYSC